MYILLTISVALMASSNPLPKILVSKNPIKVLMSFFIGMGKINVINETTKNVLVRDPRMIDKESFLVFL